MLHFIIISECRGSRSCSVPPGRKFWLLFNTNLTVFKRKWKNKLPSYLPLTFTSYSHFVGSVGISVGKPGVCAPSPDHKFLESQKPGKVMPIGFLSIATALSIVRSQIFSYYDFILLWISGFSPEKNLRIILGIYNIEEILVTCSKAHCSFPWLHLLHL